MATTKKSRRGLRQILAVEVMLLQTLARGNASYGEELIRTIARRTDNQIVISIGAAYVALKRLEEFGFIEFDHSGDSLGSMGGRPANYFRVTLLGEQRARKNRALIGTIFGLS